MLDVPLRSREIPASMVDRDAGEKSYDFSQLSSLMEKFRDKLNVAVIYGRDRDGEGAVVYPTNVPRNGESQEIAAANIADSLRRNGFKNVDLFAEDICLGQRLRENNVHIAWNSSAGVQGENPSCHLPALLEMAGIPYVGHGPLNASILGQKHSFKRELHNAGIPTAPYITWDSARGPFLPEINSRFWVAFGDGSGPFVIKPVHGCDARNLRLLNKAEDLSAAVAEVYLATKNVVLVERFLPGREFSISVCGPVISRGGELVVSTNPFTFSVLECVHEPDQPFFVQDDAQKLNGTLYPVNVSGEPELYAGLTALAQRIFLDFNLQTLARITVRADADGHLHVLKMDPMPDIGVLGSEAENRVCAGLGEHGMVYDELVMSLLADRIDYYLSHKMHAAEHLWSLR